MPWEVDEARIRSLVESSGAHPWARAWSVALLARGGVGMGDRAAGLLHSVDHEDWSLRMRPVGRVRLRVEAIAHLSAAADALGGEELERFGEAWDRFEAAEIPAEDLEHPELGLVLSLLEGRQPDPGVREQLTGRAEAGAALAWALGGLEGLEQSADLVGALSERIATLDLSAPRSVDAVLDALDGLSEDLAGADPNTRRHSVLVERRRALRWLVEPWWPELALTPWKSDDSQVERSVSEPVSAAPEPAEPAVRSEVDETLRAAPEVYEMGLSLLLHGAYLADAHLQSELLVAPMVKLGRQSGIEPTAPCLAHLVEWSEHRRGTEPSPHELDDLVWLSACADALFWAVGVLDELPDGDPDEHVYTALIPLIRAGGVADRAQAVGLRSRAEIEAEHQRWQQLAMGSEARSLEQSFGIQRARALRWVLETRWADPTQTPWDASEAVAPFSMASRATSSSWGWGWMGLGLVGLAVGGAAVLWWLS